MTIALEKPDYAAIKSRQQATWSSGDYAIIGTTLQIVGESLCEAVELCAGERVLDVAAGNGNATLAAARRFAEVTSTDYVGDLLDSAKERAKAERLTVAFRQADAEALAFADASFDVALSTFGVMFTPDQERASNELVRAVCKGGRIGLANSPPVRRASTTQQCGSQGTLWHSASRPLRILMQRSRRRAPLWQTLFGSDTSYRGERFLRDVGQRKRNILATFGLDTGQQHRQ